MQIESGERIVVGVNKFKVEEDQKRIILKVDPQVEIVQKKKLQKLRQERDNIRVKETIDILTQKARTDENLMPYILEAVKAYATLGEICGALREVFGEYEQSVIL